MGRNTRLGLVFLPIFLECSSRFLRALKQNRAQSRLLYLLIVASFLRSLRTHLTETKPGRKKNSKNVWFKQFINGLVHERDGWVNELMERLLD